MTWGNLPFLWPILIGFLCRIKFLSPSSIWLYPIATIKFWKKSLKSFKKKFHQPLKDGQSNYIWNTQDRAYCLRVWVQRYIQNSKEIFKSAAVSKRKRSSVACYNEIIGMEYAASKLVSYIEKYYKCQLFFFWDFP